MDAPITVLTKAILSSGNVLLREAGRLFKPHGISAAQYNVLTLLANAPGGLRPSELTAALVVDPSSTTYLLDRMTDAGWLRRADDRNDRRAWRIRLTPAGHRLYAKVSPLYAAALKEMMRGLGPVQLEPLIASLAQIQDAASSAVDAVLAVPPAAHRKPKA